MKKDRTLCGKCLAGEMILFKLQHKDGTYHVRGRCIECGILNSVKRFDGYEDLPIYKSKKVLKQNKKTISIAKYAAENRQFFAKKTLKRKSVFVDLKSPENKSRWNLLRYKVFEAHGKKCACCDASVGPFHIDHIKPKSFYPELAFVFENLQVLCESCNMGKSNLYETDWRPNS